MKRPRKKNIKAVEGLIYTPPYGEYIYSVIGHWDVNEKEFVAVSDQMMDRLIKAHWRALKKLPLIINIGETEVDGEYRSYRAANEDVNERTIINITEDNIVMPNYEDLFEDLE